MAQLDSDAPGGEAPLAIGTPETATPTTDGGIEVDPDTAEEGDAETVEPTATTEVTEDVVEEETVPEPEESSETDKPAGSIHLTVSMGAAIALLVTSAF